MRESVTVAVVDGDARTREGLIRRLRQMPEISVLGGAMDPDEALSLVSDRRPAVLVIDHRGMLCEGAELLGRVRAAAPGVGIVVLTSYVTEPEGAELRRAGAHAIVVKEIDSEALVRTIRAVAERRAS